MNPKPRIRPKESSENQEFGAELRLAWESGVSGLERLISNTSPLPVATLAGPDHILCYVNPAFCRLASKTNDELSGKRFDEVVGWAGCLRLLNRYIAHLV